MVETFVMHSRPLGGAGGEKGVLFEKPGGGIQLTPAEMFRCHLGTMAGGNILAGQAWLRAIYPVCF